MAKHIEIGQRGEDIASAYLIKNTYKIVHKNYRAGRAEIDIIVEKRNILIFIEVKSGHNSCFGPPDKNVSKNKIKMLFSAATLFQANENWNKEIRFDLICITFFLNAYKLEHFEDAFS